MMSKLQELKENIWINRSRKKVSGILKMIKFKQGESIVCFIPSLDLSSYGLNTDEALEMMNVVIEDYFNELLQLSNKEIASELISLGFIQTQHKNKRYERPYIDTAGVLHEFDIDEKTLISDQMLELAE